MRRFFPDGVGFHDMKTIRAIGWMALTCAVGTAWAETVVSNAAGRLSVHFCRENLVHFRYAPNGTAFEPDGTYVARQAIAKRDADYAPVAVAESRSADAVTLAGRRLTVSVDPKTLGIAVSADGRTVFRSAAEAFTAEGEGRKASFVRDVATEEHFMGLGNIPGNDFTSLELRDRTYDLWLTANNVHAIIPLWYSSSGYGIYLCNANGGRVSFKKDYTVSLEGGEMNVYFVWGPSFKEILTTWSELAGRMHMPPRYALGLTYRGAGGFSAKDLEAVTREQQDAGIAVDVIGVEPGWHTRAYPCSFAWSDKFKDPKGFIDTMHGLGVKINFWEHPYYSPECPIAKASEPFGLWGEAIAKAEGNNSRYGFGGFVPDMTLEGARDLYWKMHREVLFDRGADGLKVDETDDWATGRSLSGKMPGGISFNAYHNLIGTLTCNFVHERFRDTYGKRTFLFSRGNWAGMQRWATSAYTDFYGFEQFVMSVIVQSCSGSYYTPEIRNQETPSDIAYMRRAQMMFLTPFPMSNEWQENAVVTRRSKAVLDCYKKYNALHYSLIPYLYSLFREQNKTGMGVVRALPFEFGDDPAAFGVSDTFLLGPSLLVHPVSDFRRTVAAKVYLPKGTYWIDWWSHATYAGGEETLYPAPADVLPLFIRYGAIIPMGHYGRNTGDVTSPDIDLLVVPSDDTETRFTLYEDDGISYDYERGVYRETEITAIAQGETVMVKIAAPKGSYKTPARSFNVKILHNGRMEERRVADDGAPHEVSVRMWPMGLIAKPVMPQEGALFECEAEGNLFDKVEINRNETKASGKGIVRNLGENAGSSFVMRHVTVAKAGLYEAELAYGNGDGGPRWLRVSVNGGPGLRLACPRTGPWLTIGTLYFPLPLKEGTNEVRFDTAPGDGWAPDLDSLRIPAEPLAPVGLPEGSRVIPVSQLLGAASVTTLRASVGFTGGTAIDGLGGRGKNGAVYGVNAAKAGPALLTVECANVSGKWQRLKLSVNGKESVLNVEPTGSDQVARPLQEMVYLKAGDNRIELYTTEGDRRALRIGAVALPAM